MKAGWFTPTLLLLLITVLGSFSATMLCEAMQRIPYNHHFLSRFEFAKLVNHFYGRVSFMHSSHNSSRSLAFMSAKSC